MRPMSTRAWWSPVRRFRFFGFYCCSYLFFSQSFTGRLHFARRMRSHVWQPTWMFYGSAGFHSVSFGAVLVFILFERVCTHRKMFLFFCYFQLYLRCAWKTFVKPIDAFSIVNESLRNNIQCSSFFDFQMLFFLPFLIDLYLRSLFFFSLPGFR